MMLCRQVFIELVAQGRDCAVTGIQFLPEHDDRADEKQHENNGGDMHTLFIS